MTLQHHLSRGARREVTVTAALQVWRTAAGEYALGRTIRAASSRPVALQLGTLGVALTTMGGELGLSQDEIREALGGPSLAERGGLMSQSSGAPAEQHAHRYVTDPVALPTGEREGRCDCGAYRRYPLEPVIPGRFESQQRSGAV